MSTGFSQRLLDALQGVERPATFCASGVLSPVLPGLEIEGLGPVALPLNKRSAAALKKLARQAPYGRGTETLVDTAVRRVWEIDAEQVTIANRDWSKLLQQAVSATEEAFGLKRQSLEAHLYKLLLYEPGSFFLPHRDGEKLDRMVATLIIALPTAHSGGELVVRHEGRRTVVDFGPLSAFHFQYAAFYADCEHEIRPVASGFRLVLAYNLTLSGAGRSSAAPRSDSHRAAVTKLLKQWKPQAIPRPAWDIGGSGRKTEKLAFTLEHRYSRIGLRGDVLKGKDRAQADLLFAAAAEAGFVASLAIVTCQVTGSAAWSGDYRSRYRGRYGDYSGSWSWRRPPLPGEEDEDAADAGDDEEASGSGSARRGPSNYVMEEVFERSLSVEHFRDEQGRPLAFGKLSLDPAELVAREPLEAGEPDAEEFEGYTGNAGMTLDRWYHRAAIVLWPRKSHFDVLCGAGLEAALGGLQELVDRWEALDPAGAAVARTSASVQLRATFPARKAPKKSAKRRQKQPAAWGATAEDEQANAGSPPPEAARAEQAKTLRAECLTFAGAIIAGWGQGQLRLNSYRRSDAEETPRLLSMLARLKDRELVSKYISHVLGKQAGVDPGPALGDVCQQLGWATFQDELESLFEKTDGTTLQRHARLLADFMARADSEPDRQALCLALAKALLCAIEAWEPSKEERRRASESWGRPAIDRRALLLDFTQALLALDAAPLLRRLVDYALDRREDFDFTTVQIPALLTVAPALSQISKRTTAALKHWLKTIEKDLESRANRPPQRPVDWRRAPAVGCKCRDCATLSEFLQDPDQQSTRLPMSTERRRHLHAVIDSQQLDTTHATLRKGNPHSLVCKKTQGAYERARQAYELDLQQRKQVQELLATLDES